MTYVGRGIDAISNVEKLDNITFDGSTTYNLTKSSVAFTPSGKNNILVSINGVVQQGNFTVAGATIIFDFSPSSNDTCNFIMHYGTGVLNTPADDTVKTATVQDDAITTDKLANSINSAITANTAKTTNATHSGEVTGATALTIADNIVDEANLKVSNAPTNGYSLTAQSGNTGGLTWANVGSVYGTQYFAANRGSNETHTNQSYGKIGINNELVDVGNNYDTSNYRYVVPITGLYFFYARGYFDANADGQLSLVEFHFKKNASDYVAESQIDLQNNPGRRAGTTLTAILSLSEDDYIEWWAQVKDTSGNPTFIAHSGVGVAGSANQFGGWRIA